MIAALKTTTLGEVCKFRHGGTPSKGNPKYWRGDIPWVSPKDMRGWFIEDTEDHISSEAVANSATQIVPLGTVLVVARSGVLANRLPVAITRREVSLNQDIRAIIPIPEHLTSEYLQLLLKAHESLILRDGVKRGATVHSLKSQYLESFEIQLPPVVDQKRIAAILNEQMAAVEKARAAAEAQGAEAARLQSAYFRQAFRGIVPLAVLETEQSPPPPGWRWHKLGDIARLESGHTPSRNRPDWWGGDVPWLALPDIRNLDGKVAKETTERTNEQGLANSSARLLPEGTVCLSRTASVGFVTVLGRPMATSQDFVNWICGPKLDPLFLMHLLRVSRDYVRSLSSGAIHKTVYMPTVKAFRVCVPDLEEQQRIATFLNVKLKEGEVLRRSIDQSTSDMAVLPAVLLRRAFSGQI